MGYNPQESLENTIITMGTLLGVHLMVPWIMNSSLSASSQWNFRSIAKPTLQNQKDRPQEDINQQICPQKLVRCQGQQSWNKFSEGNGVYRQYLHLALSLTPTEQNVYPLEIPQTPRDFNTTVLEKCENDSWLPKFTKLAQTSFNHHFPPVSSTSNNKLASLQILKKNWLQKIQKHNIPIKIMFQMSHEKNKHSYFPLYWLVHRNPYNGLL